MPKTTRKARPARLDQDRNAKPLTEIKVRVHVTNSGKILPHAHEEYVIRDTNPHGDADPNES